MPVTFINGDHVIQGARLTLDYLEGWARALPPDDLVGRAHDACKCPLAEAARRFIGEQGLPLSDNLEVMVEFGCIAAYYRGGPGVDFDVDFNPGQFYDRVDALAANMEDKRPITAGELLDVIAAYRAEEGK